MTGASRIRSISIEHPYEVLDPAGVATVHERTLRLLERVGVALPSASLLAALGTAGADVAAGDGRVRFAPALVEEVLRRAPQTYLLAARDPAADLVVGAGHGYLGADGSAAELVDLATGERRPSTLADLAAVMRVADATPEIAFVWPSVAARDVPQAVAPLHELRAQLRNTSKHIQLMTAVTPEAARGAVEMARMVTGGEAALRARPVLSSFQCSVSPLAYEPPGIEAAIVFAQAGIPCGFVVMPLSGATAPATVAATIVQANAEVLAGVTMLELLVPGASTFYGACPTVMDLRTGAPTGGGPEDLLYQLAAAQLARHYGLPSNIGTFATGARVSDWQAGMDGATSLMAAWLGGADMICGAGLLRAAALHSTAQMLLDAELFGVVARLADGIRLDEEELASDLLETVAAEGHFLAERHTAVHIRRLWRPSVIGREPLDAWEAAGRPTPFDHARGRACRILDSHEVLPLDPGVGAALDRFVESRSVTAAAEP
jgi:trimethylamine--corrinoid protein Co-methyltransferase